MSAKSHLSCVRRRCIDEWLRRDEADNVEMAVQCEELQSQDIERYLIDHTFVYCHKSVYFLVSRSLRGELRMWFGDIVLGF